MDNILAVFGVLVTVKGLLVWLAPEYAKRIAKSMLKLSNSYYRLLGLTILILGIFTLWLAWLRTGSFPF